MKSVRKRGSTTIKDSETTTLNVITKPISVESSVADTTPQNVIISSDSSIPVVAAAASVPKRASRKKSFPVVAVVTADGIKGTLMPEKKKPLIAHLPFSSTEVLFHDGPVSYDPRPPEANVQPFDEMEGLYDSAATINDVFVSGLGNSDESIVDNNNNDTCATTTTPPTSQPIIMSPEPLPVFTRMDLNLYSREGGQIEVPEHTDVACFWCVHQFEGRPVFLPYDEKDGVWHVYGNFCSPECALAYCIDEKEDQQLRWEKIALLHRLYANVIGGRIYPAPARIVLKHFGGRLGIEEYRATVRKGKVRMDIHYPPMVSLLATMDTKPIDFYETTIPKTFVPLNSERVKKVEEGLRLKRSKPLKDKESTLDACMNLQIKRA